MACGLLSSCDSPAPGVVSSVVVARGSSARGLYSLRCAGSLVETCELCSCGAQV